jgi:hypothetical protein
MGAFVKSLFTPNCQHITVRIGEMESSATGEGEDIDRNGASGGDDFILYTFQIFGVQDHQRIAARYFLRILVKAAGYRAVFKSSIVVAIVGKGPAEGIAVKSLDDGNSPAIKFNVVDGCLTHGFRDDSVNTFFANVAVYIKLAVIHNFFVNRVFGTVFRLFTINS